MCTFLSTADVHSLSCVNRTTRQLLFSSPAVWRSRVWTRFPFSSSFTSSSTSSSRWRRILHAISRARRTLVCLPSAIRRASIPNSSAHFHQTSSTVPSLCDVVQVVDTRMDGCPLRSPQTSSNRKKWKKRRCTLADLARYPNLRRVLNGHLLQPINLLPSTSAAPINITPSPSLSSMYRLTCLSLTQGGWLSVDDMRLLSTLPRAGITLNASAISTRQRTHSPAVGSTVPKQESSATDRRQERE